VKFTSDLDDGYFEQPKQEETFDDDAMAEINGFLEVCVLVCFIITCSFGDICYCVVYMILG
jgi:hypothetical protein